MAGTPDSHPSSAQNRFYPLPYSTQKAYSNSSQSSSMRSVSTEHFAKSPASNNPNRASDGSQFSLPYSSSNFNYSPSKVTALASIHDPQFGFNITDDNSAPTMPQSASWNTLQHNAPTSPLVGSPNYNGVLEAHHMWLAAEAMNNPSSQISEDYELGDKYVQSPVHRLKAKIANSRGSNSSSEASVTPVASSHISSIRALSSHEAHFDDTE